MAETSSLPTPSSSSDSDVKSELQELKSDLLAVKEDIGKVTSTAVEQGRDVAGAVKDQAIDQFERGVNSAREYVKERPLTSAFVAIGVGVLAGILLARR